MAGKTAIFETEFLKLIFWNQAITLIGDASGILPAATTGSLYLSLHTSDPTDAASNGQTTGETTYPDYVRIEKPRNNTTWAISGNQVTPLAAVDFPVANASMGVATQTIGWVGIGTAPTGNGKLLYIGALTPSILVTSGVTPRLTTASSVTEA